MKILQITDPAFRKYGRKVEGIDFTKLVDKINGITPLPDGVAYEPSVPELEELDTADEISAKLYGELPIEIGYCNGHNAMLNALEYHRSSEINIAATDAVLMVGLQQDITEDFTYDTSLIEAFLVPKGTAVEIYATTLHYAPCNPDGAGFKVGIVLPKVIANITMLLAELLGYRYRGVSGQGGVVAVDEAGVDYRALSVAAANIPEGYADRGVYSVLQLGVLRRLLVVDRHA